MVKLLSEKDHNALSDAVHDAEKQTGADFAVVVARASDEYRAVALACGIALGGLVALYLWHTQIVLEFPWLLVTQFGICAVVLSLPFLRHLCLHLVPRRMLVHRAAQRAAAEYLQLTHRLPTSAPVVLLYVSLAERYVHIYASRLVREKIPDSEWNEVVATLTSSVEDEGICAAVIKAVEQATIMLKAIFPSSGRGVDLPNVIEIIN